MDFERQNQAKTRCRHSASPFSERAKLAVTMLSISLANGEPWKYGMEGTFSSAKKKNKIKSYCLPANMKKESGQNGIR